MSEKWAGKLEKVSDFKWILPQNYLPRMKVPGLIYASEKLLEQIRLDQTPQQVANVACLPGIVKYSLAMPDIHWGYGLPIGGVAATSIEEGVISPGGVGSDINCGVRLLKTNLSLEEVKPKINELMKLLFKTIPCGIGTEGRIKLSSKEINRVMTEGAKWVVKQGWGWREDIEYTEEKGVLDGANPDKVSKRAKERGLKQIGTLGAGNHFLEVQVVTEIYDEKVAKILGIFKDQITVMIHSGSRGFGFQICEDYLKTMTGVLAKYQIELPDRQLACAPLSSPEGKDYFSAMAAAANYAWANRQALMHWTREAFEKVFRQSAEKLGMSLIYDVAHNIAKIEKHLWAGKEITVCVHRKGATRAFPPHHPALPPKYQQIGQPVIIPGDMGTASYLLVGTKKAMEETFGSTCHGAGRVLSRIKAKKQIKGPKLQTELAEQGITVVTRGIGSLGEEAPSAYKDVNEVVEIVHQAGLSKKIAKMKPLGVMKG
jgi:tRNA-splicing ligase RtcB